MTCVGQTWKLTMTGIGRQVSRLFLVVSIHEEQRMYTLLDLEYGGTCVVDRTILDDRDPDKHYVLKSWERVA